METYISSPELSDKEYETTKRLKRILESFDITILDVPLETGLVAEIGRGEPESFDITILDVPLETGLVAEIGRVNR